MKLLDKFIERQTNIIQKTNPRRVKVTDIARFFFIPQWFARFLLNQAVREELFKKNKDGTFKLLKESK